MLSNYIELLEDVKWVCDLFVKNKTPAPTLDSKGPSVSLSFVPVISAASCLISAEMFCQGEA